MSAAFLPQAPHVNNGSISDGRASSGQLSALGCRRLRGKFTTSFSATGYACAVTATGVNAYGDVQNTTGKLIGSVVVNFFTSSTTLVDPTEGMVICYGRQ
jgi:hypothetical protein